MAKKEKEKKKKTSKPIIDYSHLNEVPVPLLVAAGLIVGFVVFRLMDISIAMSVSLPDALNEMGGPAGLIDTSTMYFSQKAILSGIGAGLITAGVLKTSIEANKVGAKKAFGSAEWHRPSETYPFRAGDGKDPHGNILFTQTEWFSHKNRVTGRNRNVILLGRPGTGKSRYFFKPNLLNAEGTIIATDPKGELLRDCGYALKQKGYDIKVLDLTAMWRSNKYNPLKYIKKVPIESLSPAQIKRLKAQGKDPNKQLAEEDVMSLINVIMKNTKGDIDQTSGDPFWEKAEMIYLQAIIYYVMFRKDEEHQNFKEVLEMMRLSSPESEDDDSCELDSYFDKWAAEDPTAIGVKQWEHFKTAKGRTLSSILMTATARLAPLNISAVEKLISEDNMELERIGMPTDEKELEKLGLRPDQHGKVAYFIITDPGDSTFNFIANIMYTQIFSIININAKNCGGSLPTNVDLYMDEWAQLGEIPRFVEELAYVRGLNVGVVIGLQSLDQLKKRYKEAWQTALDCCDYILFLGSASKDTLEYISQTYLGKTTVTKRTNGRSRGKGDSHSDNWDEQGRELATVDELSRIGDGECILWVAKLGAFHSQLFKLQNHPDYGDIYEPWNAGDEKNDRKKYDHAKTLADSFESDQIARIMEENNVEMHFVRNSSKVEHWTLV